MEGEQKQSKEREFEVGMDEGYKAVLLSMANFTLANMKRTYDEYQNSSLESIKQNQSYVQKVLSDAQQNDNARQNIANQSLQNAVENANMSAKQAIRHADLAIDRQWNIDEVAMRLTENEVFTDAIAAKVAKVVNRTP